ncbi:hypothetical protein M758_5G133400 [Ceratodon purpureus]|nr:hypothetical protein M758_5G133400 [Ceratodon purpureus]
MLNPAMASAFLSKTGADIFHKLEKTDHVDTEYRRLEKRQSFREKIFGQLGADTFHQKLDKPDHVDINRRLEKRRSFTERIIALGADAFHQKLEKPDNLVTCPRLQRRHTFTEKILAIQSSTHPGRPAVLPPDCPPKKTLRIRVARARVQCHRHFLNGFEKLETSEAELAERRHALAQKLIAKTLRQADRRRRSRRRLIFRVIRKKMILSPIMACVQWLREPLVRLARIASLAAAKVELHQATLRGRLNSARVTSFPLIDVDNLPLLTSNSYLE